MKVVVAVDSFKGSMTSMEAGHVSILCGDILSFLIPYEWEQSYRSRKRRALFRSLLAFLLMGVTGFTPSVCRAAVAVWVSALGV